MARLRDLLEILGRGRPTQGYQRGILPVAKPRAASGSAGVPEQSAERIFKGTWEELRCSAGLASGTRSRPAQSCKPLSESLLLEL